MGGIFHLQGNCGGPILQFGLILEISRRTGNRAMTIDILTVGKIKDPYYSALLETYLKRLGRYIPARHVVVKGVKGGGRSPKEIKHGEWDQLQARLTGGEVVIALDERGHSFRSEQLARWLQEHQQRASRTLVFVVGGPFGLDPECKRRAHLRLSLSALTLPHELAVVVLTEQLYRAFTILKGERYHK